MQHLDKSHRPGVDQKKPDAKESVLYGEKSEKWLLLGWWH